MIKNLIKNRRIILQMTRSDFKNKFAGSYMGVIWAFVQPIVVISVYWMIFEKGLKSHPLPEYPDYPYLLWLIAGICPWFFLNDAVNNSSNCMIEYSYIVKKMKFNIDIIPFVKVLSSTIIHLFFIALVFLMFIIFGKTPNVYAVQFIYYSFCVFALNIALVYLISALTVFVRDVAQIVSIILQYAMWVTPIMISENQFPEFIRPILKYNPMYYVVEGYRDAFIKNIWFYNRPYKAAYFWGITIIIGLFGRFVFKKLRPQFADVL